MSTEYKYICDGCGTDISKVRSTSIELQEYDRRPEEEIQSVYREYREYSRRTEYDLYRDCVKDVVSALKSKGEGVVG